ncbi:MAG: histidine phosphatase family protein, partial [Candidatus Schekmanbacteria bacterium]
MKRIILIRHGESLLNEKKCVQGQLDSHLTERGKKQALTLLSQLKDINTNFIISSPLKRAKETAEIIADNLNVKVIIE